MIQMSPESPNLHYANPTCMPQITVLMLIEGLQNSHLPNERLILYQRISNGDSDSMSEYSQDFSTDALLTQCLLDVTRYAEIDTTDPDQQTVRFFVLILF